MIPKHTRVIPGVTVSRICSEDLSTASVKLIDLRFTSKNLMKDIQYEIVDVHCLVVLVIYPDSFK